MRYLELWLLVMRSLVATDYNGSAFQNPYQTAAAKHGFVRRTASYDRNSLFGRATKQLDPCAPRLMRRKLKRVCREPCRFPGTPKPRPSHPQGDAT